MNIYTICDDALRRFRSFSHENRTCPLRIELCCWDGNGTAPPMVRDFLDQLVSIDEAEEAQLLQGLRISAKLADLHSPTTWLGRSLALANVRPDRVCDLLSSEGPEHVGWVETLVQEIYASRTPCDIRSLLKWALDPSEDRKNMVEKHYFRTWDQRQPSGPGLRMLSFPTTRVTNTPRVLQATA